MKTSTMMFNGAAVITLLAVLCALVNLAKNKTKSYGLTPEPGTMAPIVVSTAPIIIPDAGTGSAPILVTTAPPMMAQNPFNAYGAFPQPQQPNPFQQNPYQNPMQPNPFQQQPMQGMQPMQPMQGGGMPQF